jgi:hypothetical protein
MPKNVAIDPRAGGNDFNLKVIHDFARLSATTTGRKILQRLRSAAEGEVTRLGGQKVTLAPFNEQPVTITKDNRNHTESKPPTRPGQPARDVTLYYNPDDETGDLVVGKDSGDKKSRERPPYVGLAKELSTASQLLWGDVHPWMEMEQSISSRKRISCETSFKLPARGNAPLARVGHVFSIMRALAEPKNEAVPIATARWRFSGFSERCLPRRMGRGQSSICPTVAASAVERCLRVANDALERRRPWRVRTRSPPAVRSEGFPGRSAGDGHAVRLGPDSHALGSIRDDAVEVFLHGERGELRWFTNAT